MAISKIGRNSTDTGITDGSNATAITIDSAENVGIGTTPESHHANWSAIDFGDQGGLAHYDGGATSLSTNLYHDGAWKAKETGTSSRYEIGAGGTHNWYSGANANADAAVTLTNTLAIDARGRLTQPLQPSFVVSYNNASYNWGGTTNGTLIKMAFNSTGTNGHNTGSLWNTSNTRMEAPVAGRYHVGVQWFNNYSSDYARIGAHISINGSTKYQSYVIQWEAAAGNNCSAIVNLSADQYVEFWGSIYDGNATSNSWTGYGGAIETYGYGYLIG